jgi:hypothetical protein
MRTLFNPWFIVGCFTWAIVIAFRKLGHPVPCLNGHINDFFAIPVIANLALWFQRVMYKTNYYVLAPWHVIFIVVYVSVVFEGILPRFSIRYTADWMDVLLYVIGGLFFYWVMNKPLAQVKKTGRFFNSNLN